jgi:hypothetical protein
MTIGPYFIDITEKKRRKSRKKKKNIGAAMIKMFSVNSFAIATFSWIFFLYFLANLLRLRNNFLEITFLKIFNSAF